MNKHFILFAVLLFTAFACNKQEYEPGFEGSDALEFRSQVSGAIFTTDETCTGVNVNIFGDKKDVYLDGGPRKPGSAGLPDGWYYVKVTDPSGASLLGYTPTPVVQVVNGEFVQCYRLWDILIYIQGQSTKQGYKDTPNNGGVYKVWASQYQDFPNDFSKTDNFKVKKKAQEYNLNVIKFYDANADGINNDGILLPGWKVRIFDAFGFDIDRFTPVSILLGGGTYTVSEYFPMETNWMATTPTSVNVNLSNSNPSATVEFGNVCLGYGGGKTRGFWQNNNGEEAFRANYEVNLAAMVALNLRTPSGGHFDPANYEEFADWIVSPAGENSSNMSYKLSVQLAAMKLNVLNGFVNGSAIVYAPGAGGFVTVNALMAAADMLLASYDGSQAGSFAYAEALKNALDEANNNRNFVQAIPCIYTFSE